MHTLVRCVIANNPHSRFQGNLGRLLPLRAAAALVAVLMILLIEASPAAADADLIKTYSPIVQPGILEFEARGHGSVGLPRGNRDAQAQLYELGYGVTNWWSAALLGSTQQQPQSGLQFNAVGMENIFQLTTPGEYYFDTGLYLEYAHGTVPGVPQDVEAKILLQKSYGRTTILLNIAVDKTFGKFAQKGVGSSYSAEVTRPMFRNRFTLMYAGLQAFGETGTLGAFAPFDRQNHVFGPVIGGEVKIGKLPGVLEYEAGYLFGITSASAAGTPKFILAYEFPF